MSREPRTKAGRRLYDSVRIHNQAQRVKADDRSDARWLRAILDIEDEVAATTRPEEGLRDALRDTLSALSITVTNVPRDGARPHWCSFAGGRHESTCAGMLAVQDSARVALAGGTEETADSIKDFDYETEGLGGT